MNTHHNNGTSSSSSSSSSPDTTNIPFMSSFASTSTTVATAETNTNATSLLPKTEEDFRKALQEAFVQGTQAATLPKSPEEFAQALQEAFTRGAQAVVGGGSGGGFLRKTQSGMLSTVVSCPDLYRAASPVVPMVGIPQVATSTTTTSSTITTTDPTMMMMHDPLAPQQQQQQHRAVLPLPTETRSYSMPDMTALQQEDLKRQNRLARNRASARQRRLRKKCLVESYEAQVVALEQRLKKLHHLQWGDSTTTSMDSTTNATSELLDALSLDRGQDELKLAERQHAAAQALGQQLQAVLQLEQVMEEQFAVYQVALGYPVFHSENEEDELKLDLSEEQIIQLQEQAKTWQDEWDALQTTKEMLQALQEHEWLWKNGIKEAVAPYKSLLSKQQRTKWYIWADANGEALDELYVVEPQYTDGPLFQFGTEDLMPEDAAKMKQAKHATTKSSGEGEFDWVF